MWMPSVTGGLSVKRLLYVVYKRVSSCDGKCLTDMANSQLRKCYQNLGARNTGDAHHPRQASRKTWQNGQARRP